MRSIQRVFILLIVLVVILLGLVVNFCLRIQVPMHIQNLADERKNIVNTIDCHFVKINDTKKCIKFDHEFYLPLESFKHHFDFDGVVDDTGQLSLFFTNATMNLPSKPYETSGAYMWYSRVNVELRDRVKLISGQFTVPISSQWNKTGHIYPVQVAQYGLSYFSKWLTETDRHDTNRFMINDPDKWAFLHKKQDSLLSRMQNGFEFTSKGQSKLVCKLDEGMYENLYLNAIISTDTWLGINIEVSFRQHAAQIDSYMLTYKSTKSNFTDQLKINRKSKRIVYSIGGFQVNFHLMRNICVDLCKALNVHCVGSDLNTTRSRCRITSIHLDGRGRIYNISFDKSASYLDLAKHAANYLVRSQNQHNGGWNINAIRGFSTRKLYLNKEWYSGLAQGQAISLLCRMYLVDRDLIYLKSAIRAFEPFTVNTSMDGVRRYFMDKLIWFEEYPTRPNGLFVLNGFLYSLFGLHDLIYCLKMNVALFNDTLAVVQASYASALVSLEHMINFYDSGSRSFYDLRHVETVGVMPNLARWDYHVLHVSQLFHLLTIEKSDRLQAVANRWLNYTVGIWSKHN